MSNNSDRQNRLLSTLLNVLIAGLSDPSRLSRGRTYARQGAVVDLDVQPGVLTAAVQGSRSAPYEVSIYTELARDVEVFAALVPSAREIDFECTCPDWDDPCKHAVAVMTFFSEVVSTDPSLLARWRGAGAETAGPRAVVGSRGERRPAAAAPTPESDKHPELLAYLGATIDFEQPVLSSLALPNSVWDEPWTAMLRSAITMLESGR